MSETIDLTAAPIEYSATELSVGFEKSASHLHQVLKRYREKGIDVPGEYQDPETMRWTFNQSTVSFLESQKADWKFSAERLSEIPPEVLEANQRADQWRMQLDDALEAVGERDQLSQQLETLRKANTQLENDLEHERSERSRLQQDLQASKSELTAAETRVAGEKARAEKAEALVKAHEIQISSLEERDTKQVGELARLQAELTAREAAMGWWSRRRFQNIHRRLSDTGDS